MLTVKQIPVLNDNYIYLIHDSVSGETAVVDPAIAEPVQKILKERNWQLSCILNTHHHSDHVGANLTLKKQTGCQIIGSHYDKNRIPGLDRTVSEGDSVFLGRHKASVIDTPGHTLGHIVYYFSEDNFLFCGDTLFSMGCGRLFEGTAMQMHHSLNKLAALPLTTQLFCAHEYTQQNGQFAQTLEPNNTQLHQRITEVAQLRQNNIATVPSTLAQEKATNPFLRSHCPELIHTLAMHENSRVEIFTETRRRKDHF
ncbi:MAG: hydroxyacylglutathione hydrolase [Methylococcales bacterium]|jgi:hydroxyacylglutathione hydrolase|nr:hydroxyacylglutathione hydrolase [Methylococcales bacterium]MBT7107544.1 hydroxyacylglutathione hydrolase [Methylococcales bacterium]